jgi:hypothetical protein
VPLAALSALFWGLWVYVVRRFNWCGGGDGGGGNGGGGNGSRGGYGRIIDVRDPPPRPLYGSVEIPARGGVSSTQRATATA